MHSKVIKSVMQQGQIGDRIIIRMVLSGRIHEGEITLTDEAMRQIHTDAQVGQNPIESLVRLLTADHS